jgi:hypothetical protein
METTQSDGSSDWKEIAPLLDAALDQLAEEDRALLLLHYFERKTAREIAAALSLGEAAAHKRLSRALMRLRRMLAPATLSAAALASKLSAEAALSAPAGLSASVAAAALEGITAGGIGITTLKVIAMSKLKVSAVSTIGALLLAGVATPIIWQHQLLNRLHQENSALRQEVRQAETARAEKEALSRQIAAMRMNASLNKAQLSELLRLRGEVGLLRKESQELARLRSTTAPSPTVTEPRDYFPATAWANVGADKPEAAIQTFFWAGKQGETNVVCNLLRWQRDPAIPASQELDDKFTASMISGSANFARDLEGFRITSVDMQGQGDEARLGVEVTNDFGNTQAHTLRLVREEKQWFPVMHVWLDGPGSIHASLDVPRKFRETN